MPTSNRTKADRRKIVWGKTGGRCAHCGRLASSKSQTIDHFVARSAGGRFDLRNLMPLCRQCNEERGNEPVTDPGAYYAFAPGWIVEELFDYERELEGMRSRMG